MPKPRHRRSVGRDGHEVLGATRVLAQAAGAARPGRWSALVMVSWVVKVLEATMNRVRAGSSRASVSARWAASTLETKCGSQVRIAG